MKAKNGDVQSLSGMKVKKYQLQVTGQIAM
jgi:hypothetical protein